MALLASYWLQSEYGDWISKEIDLQLADAFQYVQKGVENVIKAKSDIDFSEQVNDDLIKKSFTTYKLKSIFDCCIYR